MEIERRALKRDEYFSFKYLMAINAASETILNIMGDRLKLIGRPAREMKRIFTTSEKLIDLIMYTIPANQLKAMKNDLHNTEFFVRTNKVTKFDNDEQDYISVSRKDMQHLISYIMHANCEMCDKTGKAARRCDISRLLRSLCVYDTPEVMPDGTCFYNIYQPEYADDILDRLEQHTEDYHA